MQDDEKDFKEYIETLPTELKQAIYSIDYPQKLQQIVRNNKLMIDQAGKLEAETTLVMAGIEPMDNYVKNLIANVGLTSLQATAVAHDVNELIFKNIRDALRKINEEIAAEENLTEETAPAISTPTKEDLLAGIENPENIKSKENSVSFSSLNSNNPISENHEVYEDGIQIKINNNLPEIAPKAILPMVSSLVSKPAEPFHQNIAPVQNIVESKLKETVIVPKQVVIIEEKTKLPAEKSKLPEIPKSAGDPYREPVL